MSPHRNLLTRALDRLEWACLPDRSLARWGEDGGHAARFAPNNYRPPVEPAPGVRGAAAERVGSVGYRLWLWADNLFDRAHRRWGNHRQVRCWLCEVEAFWNRLGVDDAFTAVEQWLHESVHPYPQPVDNPVDNPPAASARAQRPQTLIAKTLPRPPAADRVGGPDLGGTP